MKYTASMTVSRNDLLLKNAVTSVLRRQPDEAMFLVDPHHQNVDNMCSIIEIWADNLGFEGKLKVMSQITGDSNHHNDVVRSYHHGIVGAKYNKVLWCDDDDEVICDPQKYLDRITEDVGFVYGDVLAIKDNKKFVRKSKQMMNPWNVAWVKGSVQIWNRDAFNKVKRHIDVHRADVPRDASYGYFCDRKMYYWMLRMRYKAIYIPTIFSIQNITETPPERKRLFGTWKDVLKRLDATPEVRG